MYHHDAGLADYVEALEHVIEIVGEERVGIGTDFTQVMTSSPHLISRLISPSSPHLISHLTSPSSHLISHLTSSFSHLHSAQGYGADFFEWITRDKGRPHARKLTAFDTGGVYTPRGVEGAMSCEAIFLRAGLFHSDEKYNSMVHIKRCGLQDEGLSPHHPAVAT